MATEKQIEANRRNAEKSTGPRTPEGKSITRLNAKRDGITGQIITLSQEDLPIFEALKKELIADLAPKTTMELKLASSIAWDTWRLDHLRAVEMNMYAMGPDNPGIAVNCSNDSGDDSANVELQTAMTAAVTFSEQSDKFARLSIYEQRMNRSLHKNIATLKLMQDERKARHARDLEEEVLLARACDYKGLPYEAPKTRTANGSVFANNEILAAAHRLTTLDLAKITVYTAKPRVQFAGASSCASLFPESSTPSSPDFPNKFAPGTSATPLSTGPVTSAKPVFLSR